MKNVALKVPLNSLSFGNVSLNFLRVLHGLDRMVSIFPIGESGDLSAFDKLSEDFKSWLQVNVDSRHKTISKDSPTIQMWHINGSENRITPNQTLYTFYELDEPTEVEINLVKLQDKTIFSSSHAANLFKSLGCNNTHYVPLGFDPDFHRNKKQYLEGKIHFGLMGKWEKRKHTEKIIKIWAETYGNDYDYQLTCCINNRFIKTEEMNKLLLRPTNGERVGNINFLPFLPKNSQVNEYLNAIDIDLSGLSGAEGWNLPAFNATCLGKWSLVLDGSAHKDWANDSNSILIEPSGKEPAADGMFFQKEGDFNLGNIYTFDENDIVDAMKEAETKITTENKEGLELQREFTYEKTINRILEIAES